jgi:hypothetical protein
MPAYSEYYTQLRAEQRTIFIRMINNLIKSARTFSVSRGFSDDKYGYSPGEKRHMEIITKLFEKRIVSLSAQKNEIRTILSGGK